MSKYSVSVAESSDESGTWTTEIIRQVSRKSTVVSKQQTGFASEAEAQGWGAETLKEFLKVEAKRKERRSD